MIICCLCHNIMSCDKNGVGASFGNYHVYPSDRYKCRICGYEILFTDHNNAVYDHNYQSFDEYFDIKKNETYNKS